MSPPRERDQRRRKAATELERSGGRPATPEPGKRTRTENWPTTADGAGLTSVPGPIERGNQAEVTESPGMFDAMGYHDEADAARAKADSSNDGAAVQRRAKGTQTGNHAAAEADEPGQSADDLVRDRDGENAYLTARAYDPRGTLVDLWTGPAYFFGELPAEFVGVKKHGHWRWSRGGQPDPRGAELKVNSDKDGKSGTPVGQWAPDHAERVTVSVHGLLDPFGKQLVANADGPLTLIGRLTEQSPDGAVPEELDAPGQVSGPLVPGTTLSSGELVIEQREKSTSFALGASVLELRAPKALADYAFTVQPQTSPRQRVIDVVGIEGVVADLRNDPSAAQIVYHLERVPPGQVPRPSADASAPVADVLPEIRVIGDSVRCDLFMDGDRIHVEAAEPGARFAYWIDPDWSGDHGEERAVHIVATPGVRVDELSLPPSGGRTSGRRLAANPIYVQDPARVPKQGTPIDPADFLGAESFQYGARERDTATVATGAAGVTIRDHDLGVWVSIEPEDPGKGGRFAWTLERPTEAGDAGAFRALVGPGVRVHVHEVTEPGPTRPRVMPYQDFGIRIDLHEATDPADIPPQGTPLIADVLSAFPARAPDSQSFQHPLGAGERAVQIAGQFDEALIDTAIGFVPGVGDATDLAEAVAGVDKWGHELTRAEQIVAGVAAVLPFVSGALGKIGRAVSRAARAESHVVDLAAKLGKTEAEVEALMARLRHLDDDARAAARRVDEAIRVGAEVDPADLAAVDRGLRAIHLGGLPSAEVQGGLRVLRDEPRVRAPDDLSPEALDELNRTGDDTARDTAAAGAARRERVVLAGEDAKLRMAAEWLPPLEGTLDVVVHGTVDDLYVILNGERVHLDHRRLATYIRKYDRKFTCVRLVACKSGAHPNGVAQHLANKLGVDVIAPSDTLWLREDGAAIIGPKDTRNSGEWRKRSTKKAEFRYKPFKEGDATAKPAETAGEHAPDSTSTRKSRRDFDDAQHELDADRAHDANDVREAGEADAHRVGGESDEAEGKVVPHGEQVDHKPTGVYQTASVFTASNGRKYKVYQRGDIDWNQVRTDGDRRFIGKTNAEAARVGLPPQLPDGNFATLHHSQQNANGPWFEASTKQHNIRNARKPPLHPHRGKQHPDHPLGKGEGSRREEFEDIEKPEYWKWREANR